MSTEQTPEEIGYGGRTLRRFQVPAGAPERPCKSCAAPMIWTVTEGGRRMPLNPDGTSHFDTCPNARAHRKVEAPPLTYVQRRVLNAIASDTPLTLRQPDRFALSDLQRLKLIELAPNRARWIVTELGQQALRGNNASFRRPK